MRVALDLEDDVLERDASAERPLAVVRRARAGPGGRGPGADRCGAAPAAAGEHGASWGHGRRAVRGPSTLTLAPGCVPASQTRRRIASAGPWAPHARPAGSTRRARPRCAARAARCVATVRTTQPGEHRSPCASRRPGQGHAGGHAVGARLGALDTSMAFESPAGERFWGFGQRSNGGRPARARGRELRVGRALPRAGPLARRGARAAVGHTRPRRLHLLPGAVDAVEPRLRRADRRGRAQRLPAGRRPAATPGACRPTARALRARFFAGPTPAAALARFTACGRAPAPAARAVGLRAVVSDRPAQRDPAGRRGAHHAHAAQRRRTGVGRRDPDALPALRRAARQPRLPAPAQPLLPRPGPGPPGLLQPGAVRVVRIRLPARRGPRAAAEARRGRPPVPLLGVRGRQRPGRVHPGAAGAVRLHRAAAPRPSTPAWCAEAVAAGHDGWMEDFGENSPPQALLGRRQRRRRASTTATRALYHCTVQRIARRQPTPGRALPALGMDGRSALRRPGLGRRPHHRLGLRRPAVRRCARRSASACRASAAGARTSAATTASTSASGSRPSCSSAGSSSAPCRASCAPSARASRCPPTSARRSSTPACCPPGAATRSCTPSSTPTSLAADRRYRRTGLPLMSHLALSWPRRPPLARARGRVHVRAQPPGRSGGHARRAAPARVRPARPLARLLAQRPLRQAHRSVLRRAGALRARRARARAARAARAAADARPHGRGAAAAARGRRHARRLRAPPRAWCTCATAATG